MLLTEDKTVIKRCGFLPCEGYRITPVTKKFIMPQKKEKKDDGSQINYKARLEKKLYLAQENPEPIFDISDCNLKTIPSNIFVLCKVFRKEALYLQKNNLLNLSSGGSLGDLKYIKLLDISSNKFSKLPSNINELESLEVLNASHNQLLELPETIGNLTNLMLLNLSHNNLQFLPVQIGHCVNLEVLNLTCNEPLKKLPDSLGRLHSLRQLDIDSSITYPPKEICSKGINEIMKFLSQNLKEDICLPSTSTKPKKMVPDYHNFQEKVEHHEKLKQEKQKERLLFEKELHEQNQKEVQIQQKLKDSKKKLLEDVKNQQESLDAELVKFQEKKNTDRALLIQLCQEEEKKSTEICKILNSKKNLNIQFSTKWEKERKEEEDMLFALTSQSRHMERREILASMEELMKEEILKAQQNTAYRRILAVQSLASEVSAQNAAHEHFMKKRDKNTAELMDRLRQDEALQKSAVASLLEKSDAMSWELSQQIVIVEAQLADLTRLELSRRKLESECQITELNNNRIALTQLLLELFEKQAERRQALIDTIRRMEMMRESSKDSTNFWMEQYENLLKSKSHQMVKFLETVDPSLVYQLFLNGVFHYLPLLKDMVLSVDNLQNLNSDRLIKLGVTSSEDRSKILTAVRTHLKCHRSDQTSPSAPLMDLPSAPLLESLDDLPSLSASYLVPDECVICLEKKPEVVFVPCGHICCCYKCFSAIALCPLCRKPIEAAHKKVSKSS